MKAPESPIPGTPMLEMTIQGQPSALASVRHRTRTVAEAVGFDARETDQVVLAMDEALTNVIRHGYGGASDNPIEIRMELTVKAGRRGLEVVIRDYGRQVEADSIIGRDLSEVRPGGLGVHIIRTVMDSVEFAPAEGGGMLLKMIKSLPADMQVPRAGR